MSQKSKSNKKIQEEQPSIQQEIAEIHDKKQVSGKSYYLVHFKNNPKQQWKPEHQIKKNPTFHKEHMKYQFNLKLKSKLFNPKTNESSQPQESHSMDVEKQTKTPQTSSIPKKIQISKDKIKLSANDIKQQLSLDNFVAKNKSKQSIEQEKKDDEKSQTSKSFKESKLNIKPETLMISSKLKEEQLKQEMKTLTINEPKEELMKKLNPWIQKIKSISKIKGYELKNGQMMYEVEASDKNGQSFFIPPMPSEVVMKFDAFKLAGFLQDCLLRGQAEQAKIKNG